MKSRHSTASQRIATQALELSIAAPQVVAQRLLQMGNAGFLPTAADQREFKQMGNEKVQAFFESWGAMWSATLKAQMQFAQRLPSATMSAALGRPQSVVSAINAFSNSGANVVAAGLSPVHAKAVSNAKRLSAGKKR